MALHMEIGSELLGNRKTLDLEVSSIKFVTDSGQTMFEVGYGTDGKSIEIRGVDSCKVGRVIYGSALEIRPNVSNSITVSVRRFGE